MIKNETVPVVTKNKFGQNNIGHALVRVYDPNGRRFLTSNAANWLAYIGRKNEGTVNFFRKKMAVKKIEARYKNKMNPLFLHYKKHYPNKTNAEIIQERI